jgi:hypothetical protein
MSYLRHTDLSSGLTSAIICSTDAIKSDIASIATIIEADLADVKSKLKATQEGKTEISSLLLFLCANTL